MSEKSDPSRLPGEKEPKEFKVLKKNGSAFEEVVSTTESLKGFIPDLSGAAYDALTLRNFDFNGDQTFLFTLNGGLGHVFIALEAAAGLRDYISRRGKAKTEFIAVVPSEIEDFYKRWLNLCPFFDSYLVQGKTGQFQPKYPHKILDAVSSPYSAITLAAGNAWDTLWARWGVPSRYVPGDMQSVLAEFTKMRETEYGKIAKSNSWPSWKNFVLLECDSYTMPRQKIWPAENWRKLVDHFLKNTKLAVVVSTSLPSLAAVLPKSERVFAYDYRKNPLNDAVEVAALCSAARLVVSVDSGPALVAGMLKTPCITMWGPTVPGEYGHSNNVNVRGTICPPCYMSFKEYLCRDNVCMKELLPETIIKIADQALRGEYFPR